MSEIASDEAAVERLVKDFLTEHPPETTDDRELRAARFDAGLAYVHFDKGFGGLGLDSSLHPMVEQLFLDAGCEDWLPRNVIGLGMAAQTVHTHGTDEQRAQYLKPLFTGEEIWCQLFSEPGAGSDLAALGARAIPDGDGYVVNGQKIWTSFAHVARRGLLVARTDPDLPKHRGLSYFVLDMTTPGVEVRPLRQLTGQAEFNEVYLTDAVVPAADRLGAVGEGWRVAMTTLMNERVAIGSSRATPREEGTIGFAATAWRQRPERRTPELHQRLLRLWAQAEVSRLAAERLRQQLASGEPGPEGSAGKLTFALLNQEISGWEVDFGAADGLRYDDWSMRRDSSSDYARGPAFRYLRSRGNSIEGGTSEILRNIIAERVLGLPAEPRADKDIPWKDLPR